MTDPQAHAGLATALAKVQAELPEVKKNRIANVENKEGRTLYSYSYADLADVSAAIMPILGKHGLAFTAFPGHQPDGKFGLRYYLLHSGGARIEGFYEIPDQGGIQLVGGRITYARRYCLCAVTGVAADEDVDARGDGQARKARRQAPAEGDQQPQRTAQRKPRTSPDDREREESPFPPLPGDGPDERDYDSPRTIAPAQIKRIWTSLRADFDFSDDETDKARKVCSHIVSHELGSSKELSHREADTVIDTLASWLKTAKDNGEHPRLFLDAIMADAIAAEVPNGD